MSAASSDATKGGIGKASRPGYAELGRWSSQCPMDHGYGDDVTPGRRWLDGRGQAALGEARSEQNDYRYRRQGSQARAKGALGRRSRRDPALSGCTETQVLQQSALIKSAGPDCKGIGRRRRPLCVCQTRAKPTRLATCTARRVAGDVSNADADTDSG